MLKKSSTKSALITALLTSNVIWGGTIVYAEEPSQAFTLDPMVVTAQRSETRDLDTPAATTVITAKVLKDTGAVNVFDALEHTIGFNSMSYGPAGREYGMSAGRTIVRGLDKGTLVLVNGAPLNLLNYNGSSGIPLEAVEKVEVIRGANAVLYGSEALAGVINIITKNPEGVHGSKIAGSIGNYNSEWSANTDFGVGAIYVKRQYVDSVNRTSRDNLYDKSNAAVRPYGLDKGSNNSFYLMSKVGKDLVFNWSYNDLQANRPRFNVDGSRYMLYKYDDIRNNMNLIYDNKEKQFKSILSYNKRRAYSDKYEYAPKKLSLSERYNMYSINFDNQKIWNLRDNKDTLIAGLTLAREHFYDPSTENSSLRKNALRNSAALYGAYTYAFSNTFSTTLGLREHVISDYATSENVLLPQFQTLYKINDNTSWYINVGKSFQMPPINQYFSKKNADFNSLKPQQGWTYETGLKILDDNKSWKLSVYHMDIKDQFVWKKNADNTDYMSNGGDFKNTGVEVEFAQVINKEWKYKLGLSYSKPENNETGSWVQSNSRIQAIAGVNYHKNKFNGNMDFLFLGDRELSYYKINGKYNDVPNRIQLNATFRYTPDKRQSISLSLYNILDRKNSVNKYENLDLPFNWMLGYEYSF